MLTIYNVIVGGLFIALLFGFIVAFVLDGSEIRERELEKSMKNYDTNEGTTRAWDTVQKTVNTLVKY